MAVRGRPPRFKQEEDTAIVIVGRHRFLKQGKHYFSHAEYDRLVKEWQPEPQVVDPELIEELKFGDELRNIEGEIKKLMERKENILREKGDGK